LRLGQLTALVAAATVVAMAGCGGSSSKTPSASAPPRTAPATSAACTPASGVRFGHVFVASGARAGYLGIQDILTAFPLWAEGTSGFAGAPKTALCPQARQAMAAVIINYVARHRAAVLAASDQKPSDPAGYLRTHGLACGSECHIAG
jgi:hypothetical protein